MNPHNILLPTSCSCERTFSKLTIVKSKLRLAITEKCLDALILGFTEQHISTEIDIEVVNEEFKFLVTGKRRFKL
jgi:hypothetical protein